MRKEVIFAIAAGGVLGLIIAFGVWRANVAFSPSNRSASKTQASPTPKPEFAITLAKASDGDILTESSVTLSGITKSNTFVMVSGEDEDVYVRADAKGSFEATIDLSGGTNQIVLTAFDEKGSETSMRLLLVYSSEFEKYIQDNQSSQESTDTATDSVRGRVEQKVKEALSSPKAFLGTVTDISEGTLQIKTAEGEIKQLSIASDISVIKTGKTNKEVKLTDVAIGDFIIAMGFKNGNGVLDTKRILISSPLPEVTRRAVFAKVFKNNKKDILTQMVKTDEDQKIVPAKDALIFLSSQEKNTKIKFADLKENDLILGSGEFSDSTFEARTIFVVARP
ncbi:hypothetical protein A3E46_00035 [Candidatus Woesebacteria bacterium RIFCSPHIGHO2_12_FULL_46_16]|uniref:DUF5666 domain-containing protein n=1 Tax=Candidatus Woesebacteria bacterium RIFCSPHIGHO2_12_FULL_46_16 TaxID=1802513 RepID=A0A1F8AXQ2_9BACT|nr:MAG: hypothetical protein A3E46_00035 [Candidatus Woesebacteria bacterium RIFCSPHIGHO2_12_FULL_46_16]